MSSLEDDMKMRCPKCGVKGSVSESLLGKRVKCPKCGEKFRVPPEEEAVFPPSEVAMAALAPDAVSESPEKIPAQDDASLNEELAKIFQDMNESRPEEAAAEEAEEEEGETASITTQAAEAHEVPEAGVVTGSEPSEDEELESEAEDVLGETCSVCGASVENAAGSDNGPIFCSACAQEAPEDTAEGDSSPLQEQAAAETDAPAADTLEPASAEGSGLVVTIKLLLGSIVVLALILLAAVLMTSK
jgi:hypothetical protein